eukprot:15251978-Ditylum_brightwellii.AAC.1
MDVKSCKLLTTHGYHHSKANTHRLYLHRSRGGRGLTGLEDTHNNKCSVLAKYVIKRDDLLTSVVRETTSPTQKFLMKFVSAPKCTTPDLTDEKHAQELCAKPLHSKFFRKQAAILLVDLEGSHCWLRRMQLQCKTEAFICAVQEQTVVINYTRKEIFKQNVNPL